MSCCYKPYEEILEQEFYYCKEHSTWHSTQHTIQPASHEEQTESLNSSRDDLNCHSPLCCHELDSEEAESGHYEVSNKVYKAIV